MWIISSVQALGQLQAMGRIVIVLFVLLTHYAGAVDRGRFWHITDMHYDHTYSDDGLSCNEETPGRGKWGNFFCDSPWILINSSVYAMKDIYPDPDFLIWTGDDTPHIYDDDILNLDVVRSIIFNLTDKLEEVWSDKPIFSALGNHDWSPKSQLPAYPDPFYAEIATKWQRWLNTSEAEETFQKGGYYRRDYGSLTFIVLNTNLYYESNLVTAEMPDPANQMQWLHDQLSSAAEEDRKVLVLGHVPPGQFEKHPDKHWYYPTYNEMFVFLLQKFSEVIGSMHMAHHHTDSYRLIRDTAGEVVTSILLAPAVTPWETTLPGVMGGKGNNPGVRLVEYDRLTGTVLDVHQYYLNLAKANEEDEAVWELAYKATEYYDIPDFSTASLLELTARMKENDEIFDKYYKANGLFFDPNEKWDEASRTVHYCAISETLYDRYETCFWAENRAANVRGTSLMLCIALIICTLLFWAR